VSFSLHFTDVPSYGEFYSAVSLLGLVLQRKN
jgi:hypothetical protein